MFRFQARFFILFILLFLTEVAIALWVHDRIIRPYIGDVLVVILLYCFVKSFFDFPVIPLAIGVLLFSYIIEYTQYLHLVNKVGLQNSKLANAVMGNSFEWTDMLAYTVGILIVVYIEKLRKAH